MTAKYPKSKITLEFVREKLNYNPETGVFTWNSGKKAGKRAGYVINQGYRMLFDIPEHRLAWFYVYGKWPEDEIDHVNLIRDDNRIENLREATHSENKANSFARVDNKVGLKGIYKYRNGYRAQIRKNGKLIDLGVFKDKHLAHQVYVEKSLELFGEFAK